MHTIGLSLNPEMPPCASKPGTSTGRSLNDSAWDLHRSETSDLDYGVDTFSVRSTNSTTSIAVVRRWEIVEARAARRRRLRSTLEHVKSCLTPRFILHRTSSRGSGDYPGFDEYARKQSSGTMNTTSSAGASTFFDFGINAPTTNSPQILPEPSNKQLRRCRSSACLSRLSTRASDIVRAGYTRLLTDPEEEEARQRRLVQEKRKGPRRMSEIGGCRSDANQASYGPFVYGSGDPRTALGFMPWF